MTLLATVVAASAQVACRPAKRAADADTMDSVRRIFAAPSGA